jgi:hypothetical protein
MRKIQVLFILLLSFSSLYSQVFDQEIVTKAVKEKIKKSNTRFIIGWAYQFDKNVQSKQGRKCSFEKFDKEGNLIEEVYYTVGGGVNYECTRDYDKLGFEASRVTITKAEHTTRKWIYKQNSKSGEYEAWPTYSFQSQEHIAYRFDPYGRKVQESRYDRDGLSSTIFLKYDDNGNVLEKLELDGNNNLFSKRIYSYDESGNNTLIEEFDSENKLYMKYEYVYDASGNKITELVTDANGNKKQLIKYIYQPYTW